ncbi:hypothetical protein ACQKWADRAFT_315578 [Trichoderma austrokoningii]
MAITNDFDDSLTQLSSPPAPSPSPSHAPTPSHALGSSCAAILPDPDMDDDGTVDNGGDANHIKASTGFTSTEVGKTDASYRVYSLTWEDATTVFRLRTKVALKRSRRLNDTEQVYLHISPEIIKTMTCQITPDERMGSTASANHYSLHFSLTKRPDLIVPKDIPLRPKGSAKHHLKLIRRLAALDQFTLHLASSGAAALDTRTVQLLAATFSSQNSENRPCMDYERGDITSLYASNGGKVIDIDTSDANINIGYPILILILKIVSPNASDLILKRTLKRALRLMQDFIERSIAQVTHRLDEMERSIAEIKDKVESWDGDCTPCRYDSEERQDLIEDVKGSCDDQVLELKWVFEDVTEDLDKYCDKAKTDMREACKEVTAECDETFDMVKGHLTKLARVFDDFGYT